MCAGGSVLSPRLGVSNPRGSTASRGVVGLDFNGFGQIFKPKTSISLYLLRFNPEWHTVLLWWFHSRLAALLLLLEPVGCTAPAASYLAARYPSAVSCRKCLLLFRAVAYAVPVVRSRVFLNLCVAWLFPAIFSITSPLWLPMYTQCFWCIGCESPPTNTRYN